MSRFWRRANTLRGRLMFLVILALVPFLGVILVLTVSQRRDGVQHATDNALGVARLSALNQDRQIEQVHELLKVISQLPQVTTEPRDGCPEVMASLSHAYEAVANLGVIDVNGNLVCSALPTDGPVNLSDRVYFQRTIESQIE